MTSFHGNIYVAIGYGKVSLISLLLKNCW